MTVSIAGGNAVSGVTDDNGQFRFTYVPPNFKTVDQLMGTCSGCTNTAQKKIDVEVASCSRTSYSEPSRLVGNPISPATGEKVQAESDWSDPAPHPLSFTRQYRSGGTGDAAAGLGSHWSHNYAASLTGSDTGRTVRLGGGSTVLFSRDDTSQPWRSDTPDTLQQTSGGWLYTRSADDSRWLFDATTGHVLTMTERNGWTKTWAYDSAGRIASVTNAFGRSLQFAYDDLGRLIAIATPDQRVIRYGFDTSSASAPRLTGVQYADNTTKAYLYENTAFPQALTGIVDETGQRFATYTYDSHGRATGTAHAGGVDSYTIDYGPNPPRIQGQLVAGAVSDPSLNQSSAQVTDALGNVLSYGYQGGAGGIATSGASSAAGGSQIASRSFGAGNLPASETDFLGSVSTFQWDLNRQLLLSTTKASNKPEAQTTSTQWHASFKLPVLVTEAGRTTAYSYDTNGNQLTETITDTASTTNGNTARTRSWTYNPQGLVATETAPNNAVTTYGYDSSGNRTSVTDALGRQTRYAYDAAGRVTEEIAPQGLATRYTYDERGRLLTQTVQGGPGGPQATRYSYTPTGQLAGVSLPSGHAISYQYDAAQRLTGFNDNRGQQTRYTLDAAGNRTLEQVRDAGNSIAWQLARSINTLNKVGSETVGANQSTTYGYDANGERTSEANGLNQATVSTLDGLKRVAAITNAAGATASLTYNALDAVTTASDFKGVATSYGRDAQGNATAESSPDIGSKTTQYDALGLPSQSTDALGQSTSIQRDALGRPTQLSFADGKATTFGYDNGTAGDAPSEITDRSGSTTYRRDALGRVTTKTQTLANGSKLSTAYSYNAQGLLENIWYPGGGLLKHVYDATGQLSQLHWNGSPLVTDIAWTPLGQPKSWNWAFSTPLPASRSYDSAGRLTNTEFSSYVYDAAGRITSLTQQLYRPGDSNPVNSSITAATVTWSVGYDSVGRIVSFGDGTNTASFSYDANGNRLTSVQAKSGETINRSYSVQGNRLLGFSQSTHNGTNTATTSISYTHNANGDLTADGLRSYGYDAEGRLASSTTGQSDESPTTRYAHNALGQRVFKTEPLYPAVQGDENDPGFLATLVEFFRKLWNPGTSSAEQLGWAYGYDESGTLLAELGSGGAQSTGSTKHIWLPTASGPMPIAAIVNGAKFAVHADHLNTPRRLTNQQGEVAWQWEYSVYGDTKPTMAATRFAESDAANTGTTNTAPVVYNLRFPGQYFDQESGLHYNYFRTYDARSGQYTQPDPIGLAGGWNRFSYVDQNPLSFVDPKGLVKWKGEMYAVTAINLAGGGKFWFDLKSQCVNGKYAYIRLTASALGVGLGVKYTGSASSISFDDHLGEIYPEGFVGSFKMASAGFGAGLVGGYSAVRLGNNTADMSAEPSPGIGVDASISGFIGRSTLISKEIKDCGCP